MVPSIMFLFDWVSGLMNRLFLWSAAEVELTKGWTTRTDMPVDNLDVGCLVELLGDKDPGPADVEKIIKSALVGTVSDGTFCLTLAVMRAIYRRHVAKIGCPDRDLADSIEECVERAMGSMPEDQRVRYVNILSQRHK